MRVGKQNAEKAILNLIVSLNDSTIYCKIYDEEVLSHLFFLKLKDSKIILKKLNKKCIKISFLPFFIIKKLWLYEKCRDEIYKIR